eukprot:1154658-Pyramimonas_sp.AAC.1
MLAFTHLSDRLVCLKTPPRTCRANRVRERGIFPPVVSASRVRERGMFPSHLARGVDALLEVEERVGALLQRVLVRLLHVGDTLVDVGARLPQPLQRLPLPHLGGDDGLLPLLVLYDGRLRRLPLALRPRRLVALKGLLLRLAPPPRQRRVLLCHHRHHRLRGDHKGGHKG